MSRAFVKEDVEVAERTARHRSASGLPPGALNYLTARGADRLRQEAARRREANDSEAAAEIESVLASATIVEPPVEPPVEAPESVTFGATATLQTAAGEIRRYRIVGVDEIGFQENAVSWISPLGRALLGAELGDRVALDGESGKATIIEIEHR